MLLLRAYAFHVHARSLKPVSALRQADGLMMEPVILGVEPPARGQEAAGEQGGEKKRVGAGNVACPLGFA